MSRRLKSRIERLEAAAGIEQKPVYFRKIETDEEALDYLQNPPDLSEYSNIFVINLSSVSLPIQGHERKSAHPTMDRLTT
jgi:hypothetical protein